MNTSTFNDELVGRNQSAEDCVGMDSTDAVVSREGVDMFGSICGEDVDKFETDNFGGDAWMEQLQRQQENVIDENDEGLLETSPQEQFCLPFDIGMTPPTQISVPRNTIDDRSKVIMSQPRRTCKADSEIHRCRSQIQQSVGLHQQDSFNTNSQFPHDVNNIGSTYNNSFLPQHEQCFTPTDSQGGMQISKHQAEVFQRQTQLNSQFVQGSHHMLAGPINPDQYYLQTQRLLEQQEQITNHNGRIGINHRTSVQVNQLCSLLNSLITQLKNNNSRNATNNNGKQVYNATNEMDLSTNQIQRLQFPQRSFKDPRQDLREVFLNQHPPQGVDMIESDQQLKGVKSLGCQQESKFEDPMISKGGNDVGNDRLSQSMLKREKKKKSSPFPKQLWEAMMTQNPSNDDAFEWLPDGRSFVVVNPDLFCTEILDRKFKHSKYGSFVRKLHRWGFIRLTSGPGMDCFHHPKFQREKPDLVLDIKCNSRNGKKQNGHNEQTSVDVQCSTQPSLMGVEKFIRAKVITPDTTEVL